MKPCSDDCELGHCEVCGEHISYGHNICSDCLTAEHDQWEEDQRRAYAKENLQARLAIADKAVKDAGFLRTGEWSYDDCDLFVAEGLVPDTDTEDPTPVLSEPRIIVSFQPMSNFLDGCARV